jgi:hypothetical protein
MAGELDKPLVHPLTARFDFTIEYAPGENDLLRREGAPNPRCPADPQGTSFERRKRATGSEADAVQGEDQRLIVDRLEKSSEN